MKNSNCSSNVSASYAGRVFRVSLLIALLTTAATREVLAQSRHILLWDYEATVIQLSDAGNQFPDVRLGDQVRGTIKYDVDDNDGPPLAPDLPESAWYSQLQYTWVASMTILNPRDGANLVFQPAEYPIDADIVVIDNDPVDNLDGLLFVQDVEAPPGFLGEAPILDVEFVGEVDVLSSKSLPSTINLDDWPLATIAFYDLIEVDPFGTNITAEIYSLTPRLLLPGDADYDGDVDNEDYAAWKSGFGGGEMSADFNANWEVDGADYTVWRNHYGPTNGSGSLANGTVPEPATFMLLMAAAVGWRLRRRVVRRTPRSGK